MSGKRKNSGVIESGNSKKARLSDTATAATTLAAGTAAAPAGPPGPTPRSPAVNRSDITTSTEPEQNAKPKLTFKVITNDGSVQNSIWLMGAKKIFSTQLPKMPREYIVRLVMDRKHVTMVLLKNSSKVIGGICYRPNFKQHFAEIAFCAVDSTEQVKGFGTRLMNRLKEHVKKFDITHFLTYADNFAIGYFMKQGFTKEITMPTSQWRGYIKDYDGGTLMECVISNKIDYVTIRQTVAQQRERIYEFIRKHSKASVVHPGLEKSFFESADARDDPNAVPGVASCDWWGESPRHMSARGMQRQNGSLKTQLADLLQEIKVHSSAWPFMNAVDLDSCPDYLDYVKEPVDLSLISKRLEGGAHYLTKEAFEKDLRLMCQNCREYNPENSIYYDMATKLETFFTPRLQRIQ